MTATYLVMRGAAVLCARHTLSAAQDAAQGPNTRVVVRTGARPWWCRPADWSVLA